MVKQERFSQESSKENIIGSENPEDWRENEEGALELKEDIVQKQRKELEVKQIETKEAENPKKIEEERKDLEGLYEKHGDRKEELSRGETKEKLDLKRKNSTLEARWIELSDKEREKYENEEGELDMEKYAEELNKKKREIDKKLKRYKIDMPDDVFYELMNKGYKPEDIESVDWGKRGAVIGFGVAAGLWTVAAIAGFQAPILIPYIGLMGAAIGGGTGGEIVSEIKIESLESGIQTFSKEGFQDFIYKVKEEIEEKVRKQMEDK